MDLREQLEDLSERSYEATLPATWKLTEDELKERYLDLLEEGFVSPDAAKELGKSGTWFRRRMNPKGTNYDPDFALRYEQIMAADGPHREALVGHARAALVKAAKEGNVRAIEKILMAYDPDFTFMRPAAFVGDTYNVDKLVQIMPGIPTHLLEQMREALLDARKELPPGEAA
jgi:hypothetical protein